MKKATTNTTNTTAKTTANTTANTTAKTTAKTNTKNTKREVEKMTNRNTNTTAAKTIIAAYNDEQKRTAAIIAAAENARKNTAEKITADTIITAENAARIATLFTINRLKYNLKNIKQPQEYATTSENDLSYNSYNIAYRMYIDACLIFNSDIKYKDLLNIAENLSVSKYRAAVAVYDALTARDKLTTSEKQTLATVKHIIKKYKDINIAIGTNREKRDFTSTAANTAADLIQTAIIAAIECIGEKMNDIHTTRAYKNGKKRDITAAQYIRSTIEKAIRAEKRAAADLSVEQIIEFISEGENGENTAQEYIMHAFTIPAALDIHTAEDYNYITNKIKALKLSPLENKVLKYRLCGKTPQQIAELLTESKITAAILDFFRRAFNLTQTAAKKRLADLLKSNTIYQIYNVLLESGKITAAPSYSRGNIATINKRIQDKYISIYGDIKK